MDEQEAGSLVYRLKQLENKVEWAERKSIETRLSLDGIIGLIQNTKVDFEHLREMIKQ